MALNELAECEKFNIDTSSCRMAAELPLSVKQLP